VRESGERTRVAGQQARIEDAERREHAADFAGARRIGDLDAVRELEEHIDGPVGEGYANRGAIRVARGRVRRGEGRARGPVRS
jgi:hypothetical protein